MSSGESDAASDASGNVQVERVTYELDQQAIETIDIKHKQILTNFVKNTLDISLLTANANQLRLLLTYNKDSSTFDVCIGLVILSLVLEVLNAFGVICMKTIPSAMGSNPWIALAFQFLVTVITVINVLLAALIQL